MIYPNIPKKIFFLFLFCLLAFPYGCGAAKDAQARRGLMMPKKDELSRNKKYTAIGKRKTYKMKKNKKTKRKKMFY